MRDGGRDDEETESVGIELHRQRQRHAERRRMPDRIAEVRRHAAQMMKQPSGPVVARPIPAMMARTKKSSNMALSRRMYAPARHRPYDRERGRGKHAVLMMSMIMRVARTIMTSVIGMAT